jgi:hypothetical protein
MRAATPDWRTFECELAKLVRAVEEVALTVGCGPQTVVDALAETVEAHLDTPHRPTLRLAGDDWRT